MLFLSIKFSLWFNPLPFPQLLKATLTTTHPHFCTWPAACKCSCGQSSKRKFKYWDFSKIFWPSNMCTQHWDWDLYLSPICFKLHFSLEFTTDPGKKAEKATPTKWWAVHLPCRMLWAGAHLDNFLSLHVLVDYCPAVGQHSNKGNRPIPPSLQLNCSPKFCLSVSFIMVLVHEGKQLQDLCLNQVQMLWTWFNQGSLQPDPFPAMNL